ncbi:MAG: ATP-binding protein [Rhodovibrionaceae bacterium]
MSNIVIVDDRITSRRILSELAATIEEDAVIKSFADPSKALVWAKESTPDLVITDYKMPQMDGAEFIRRFRHLPFCFDVPVMVITVYEDRAFRYEALEAGATDFLLSPVDHHEFRTRSRNLLALRHQQQIIKQRAYSLEQQVAEDRQTLEEVLQESQKRLRAVIDAVPAMIYACDADQRVVFLNRYAAEKAGLRREQAIGKLPSEIFGESFGEESQSLDLKVFNSGAPLGAYETGLQRTGEEPTVMLATKTPLISGGTKVSLVVTAATDITERKAAEQEMVLAKEEAELANQSKTDFLANMSHELRTPLNAIIGFSQVMTNEMMGPIGSPKYKGYTSDINRSARHLLGIIDDILDLSKIEMGQLAVRESEVNVARIIEEVVRLKRDKAESANIALELNIPRDLPPITCDETKVKQILLNLVSNAVKFTETDGRITISAQLAADRCLEIKVSDTGIGMSQDELPVAMARFGQVESLLTRTHDGVGLGLPLVANLIQLHGGSCHIDSEKGRGTTITVRFPPERVVQLSKTGK